MSSPSTRTLSEKFDGGRIKGGMVRAHIDWIRKTHGEEGLRRVLALLPADTLHEVTTTLPTSWISFASLIALDKAISQTFGREAVRELGRFSAEQNLAGAYRIYKRDDIHEFFQRSAALHSQFQDFGSVAYEQTGPHTGRMTHTNYRSYSPDFCASAIGYYQEAIRVHGGKSPAVAETSCQCAGDEACVFEMRWT